MNLMAYLEVCNNGVKERKQICEITFTNTMPKTSKRSNNTGSEE